MNINIGCGFHVGESWLNYDVTPTARLQKIPLFGKYITTGNDTFPQNVIFGDIRKGLLSKPELAENIYCSHTLEHMCLEEMRLSLNNIYKMLKKGGSFRLIVPSLESRINHYNANKDANDFIKNISMGQEKSNKGLIGKLREIFGSSRHLWMYDDKNMYNELQKLSFSKIRKCQFGDSGINVYSEVEDKNRFIHEEGHIEVAYHCIK